MARHLFSLCIALCLGVSTLQAQDKFLGKTADGWIVVFRISIAHIHKYPGRESFPNPQFRGGQIAWKSITTR